MKLCFVLLCLDTWNYLGVGRDSEISPSRILEVLMNSESYIIWLIVEAVCCY